MGAPRSSLGPLGPRSVPPCYACKYSANPLAFLVGLKKVRDTREGILYKVGCGRGCTAKSGFSQATGGVPGGKHAVFATDGGAESAGAYPAQVGGALLEDPPCTGAEARSGAEEGAGAVSGASAGPQATAVRQEERERGCQERRAADQGGFIAPKRPAGGRAPSTRRVRRADNRPPILGQICPINPTNCGTTKCVG